jgi:hypothetical protein
MQRYAEQLILFSKSSGSGKEKEVLMDGGEGAGTYVPPSPFPCDPRNLTNTPGSRISA